MSETELFTSEDTTYYYQAKQIKYGFLWRRLFKDDFVLEEKERKWDYIVERQVPKSVVRQATGYFNSRFYSDMTNLFM